MSFLFKKSRKATTRLFYATDIHGSERTYRKFVNAGKFYNANVLVMGGDITGKLLIPVIKKKMVTFEQHFKAGPKILRARPICRSCMTAWACLDFIIK